MNKLDRQLSEKNLVFKFFYFWKQIQIFNFHLIFFGRKRERRDAEILNPEIINVEVPQ